jgi:hypothetical protein
MHTKLNKENNIINCSSFWSRDHKAQFGYNRVKRLISW